MKVYIAAPWASRDWVRVFAQACDDRGIEITHRWWEHDGEFSDVARMRECAHMDVNGVLHADVLILLNFSKSEGKAVEQGIAIALGKPIVALGKIGEHTQNIFHYCENYTWVNHPDKVWDALLAVTRRGV